MGSSSFAPKRSLLLLLPLLLSALVCPGEALAQTRRTSAVTPPAEEDGFAWRMLSGLWQIITTVFLESLGITGGGGRNSGAGGGRRTPPPPRMEKNEVPKEDVDNDVITDRADRSPRFRDFSALPSSTFRATIPASVSGPEYLNLLGYHVRYEDLRFAERIVIDTIDIARRWQRKRAGDSTEDE